MAQAPQVSGWGFTLPDWGGYNVMKKDEQAAYQKQQDYNTNMSNTAWQRGTADMKAAGINPMLAISQGPASSPTSPSFRLPNPPGVSANVQNQTAAQVELAYATADKTRAEADEVRERTPSHGVGREYTAHQSAEIRQKIGHSAMEIEEIIARTSLHESSAANVQQQTRNLKALIPNLQETLRLLKTETAQGNQKVQAALPSLEADIKRLERLFMQMETPNRQSDEAMADSPVGAVLRSIRNALKDLVPGFGILVPGRSPARRTK